MFDDTFKVEITVSKASLIDAARTKNGVQHYINELIARALKGIVIEKYAILQKMVDDQIFKPETREVVEQLIRERITAEVDQHVKDMFGDRNA